MTLHTIYRPVDPKDLDIDYEEGTIEVLDAPFDVDPSDSDVGLDVWINTDHIRDPDRDGATLKNLDVSEDDQIVVRVEDNVDHDPTEPTLI
ncbi:MAG: hypothetical protein ABEN55_12010 [Bradymonadaceae bacterium]